MSGDSRVVGTVRVVGAVKAVGARGSGPMGAVWVVSFCFSTPKKVEEC